MPQAYADGSLIEQAYADGSLIEQALTEAATEQGGPRRGCRPSPRWRPAGAGGRETLARSLLRRVRGRIALAFRLPGADRQTQGPDRRAGGRGGLARAEGRR
jgi:hypothetical protein